MENADIINHLDDGLDQLLREDLQPEEPQPDDAACSLAAVSVLRVPKAPKQILTGTKQTSQAPAV